MVGVILMVVGGIGLLLSLFWMTIWADRRRGTVVDPVARDGVVRERRSSSATSTRGQRQG